MPLSFAADIRPLFRARDVDSMHEFGLDLCSYEDVRTRAADICERLEEGSMPCDAPWPEERISLFKEWMTGGMAP